MADTRTLTVLLAPDGPAAGIRDVLADLGAARMIDGFLWATQASVSSDDVAVTAFAGAGGDGRDRLATSLRTVLARRAYDRVRLCVVVPLGEPTVSAAAEQRLAEVVAQSGSTARPVRVRALVARPGEQAAADVLARDGWHNVLLAPEEARGPGLPHRLVPATVGVVDLGRLVAPTLAGLLGLWSGTGEGPLDAALVLPGVRAARAFYRGVDASDVERELRRRVLAVDEHLPLPQGMSTASAYIENAPEACGAMAARWWDKHRHLLVGPRESAAREDDRPIGALESLRWLLRFLWASLTNAPADWYRAALNQASAVAARRVHAIVFGSSDSAYTVVVNGRVGGDRVAGWRDVGQAAERINQSLVEQGEQQHVAPTDLEPAWSDFVDGALTLVDAGERGGRAMPPVMIGAERGVLRTVDEAMPDPRQAFQPASAHLAAATGIARVKPADLLETETLHRRLDDEGRDRSLAREVGETHQALVAWSRTHEHSYGVQVGGILARAWGDVRREIPALLETLRKAAGADEAPAPRSALVPVVRFLAVLAVLAVVAAPVLIATDTLRPLVSIGIAVGAVVLWAVFVVVAYLQQQRAMFRDLAARRTLLNEAQAALANLRQALVDQRRLGAAYQQYLEWSAVVGAVLREPFGREPGAADPGVVIGSGLPMTTRTAAVVGAPSLGRVATSLRQELFSTGWLSAAWHDHRDAAARTLSWNERPHPVGSRQDLYHGVEGSALQEWGRLLLTHGTPPDVGRAAWSDVLGSLQGRRRDLDEQLRREMVVQEPGSADPVGVEAFLAGVERPLAAGQGGEFDAAHFSSTARAENRTRVVEHVIALGATDVASGLSRVHSAVQFSAASPAWEFTACAGSPTGGTVGREDIAPPPFPASVATGPGRDGAGPDGTSWTPAAPEGFA